MKKYDEHARSLEFHACGKRRSRLAGAFTLVLVLLGLCHGRPVAALSPQGHMVTGAIAYQELTVRSPKTLERILEVMQQHPDRGSFNVAIDGAIGETRIQRVMMEMARWPDDIRLGPYDHPTWHYAMRPVVDAANPPPNHPIEDTSGSAYEAFALNASIAHDSHAPLPERAVALCWLFHLVGDIHQPLHTAEWFSTQYPQGDGGGDLQFVRTLATRAPISLHWFWDIAADHGGAAPLLMAHTLRASQPRGSFAELGTAAQPADFQAWAAESFALSKSRVYLETRFTAREAHLAPNLSAEYSAQAQALMQRRITLAGYRLADVLAVLLHEN